MPEGLFTRAVNSSRENEVKVRVLPRVSMDAAAGLWRKCPSCSRLIYIPELEENLFVCSHCDYHFQMSAVERISIVTDVGSFKADDISLLPCDPLRFADIMSYEERLEKSREDSGLDEAIVWGEARICGFRVSLAVMDFSFMGGSMGSVVGEAIVRCANYAREEGIPLIVFCASGGARMQEGIISLMQMAKTLAGVGRLGRVPYISVLTHPTTGGVAASFATRADVILAEKGALVGFAGPRVIEQTTGQRLPKGFQTAEFCWEHGMVDRVVHRRELRETIAGIISVFSRFRAVSRFSDTRNMAKASEGVETLSEKHKDFKDPWEVVKLSRHPERPRFYHYANKIFDDFIELHGDRLFGDDPAIAGGIARISAIPVVIIGHNRGRGPGARFETRANNNGMPHPEGIRKAMRLACLAEKFSLPLVTFVDTPGAYPGVGAEERGQALAISQMVEKMIFLRTPIVSVVTGEGGSGGALALAVCDRLLMMENSTFSVISPEGCAAILWRDSSKAEDAASALKLTAGDISSIGLSCEVIEEPNGGAHTNLEESCALVRDAIKRHLEELLHEDIEKIVETRSKRYLSIGEFMEIRDDEKNS